MDNVLQSDLAQHLRSLSFYICVGYSDQKFETTSDLAKEFSSSTFGGIASQSDTAH